MESWDAVLDLLTSAYCRWKWPATSAEPMHATADPDPQPRQDAPADQQQDIPYRFTTYDIFTLQREATVMRPANSTYPIVDLAASGYLGKTAVNPTVAISFKTLDLFYRIRQRQPSLSTEAFMKVICDYYSVCAYHLRRYSCTYCGTLDALPTISKEHLGGHLRNLPSHSTVCS